MKKNLNENTLRILYQKNKEKILPIAVTFVSFVVFFIFVFPQIFTISSIQQEEQVLNTNIERLTKSYNLLIGYDTFELENQLLTASSALPPDKDFSSILTSISKSAGMANVSLDDFSFAVGDLSTKSAQVTTLPAISITLSVKGSLASVQNFLQKLSQSLPVSEIISLQSGNGFTQISAVFYYKPFPPLQSLNTSFSLKGLSQKESALLDTITTWKQAK